MVAWRRAYPRQGLQRLVKLTAAAVRAYKCRPGARRPVRYGDSDGLCLQVAPVTRSRGYSGSRCTARRGRWVSGPSASPRAGCRSPRRAGWPARLALCNPKHAAQWTATLERYAYPVIGNMPVAKIGTDDVLRVLRIWERMPETAQRVRQRIEKVLDAG